jgi:hypothetical protein
MTESGCIKVAREMKRTGKLILIIAAAAFAALPLLSQTPAPQRLSFDVVSIKPNATTAKAPPAPLPVPVIKSVDHGAITGEIVVQVQAVPKAKSYEIRYGAVVNGAAPSSWTSKAVPGVRPPAGIEGLTPGTLYAFQVRVLGKLGFTDWTDSATCMCV